MKRSAIFVLLFLIISATVTLSQAMPEPLLNSSHLARYPPLAIATRTQGSVRMSFQLNERGEVIEVHTLSGPPVLAASAVADVKTWQFSLPRDLFRTEWRYEAEFVYRLSGREVETNESPKLTVALATFHRVEITTDAVKPIVQY